MRVLSLFDGMSCGQIALERVGIKVDKYYASEIDANAIKVTQNNYPNTVQIGDVTKLSEEDLLKLGEIDLLIGGSPCQNLSITVINNVKHNQGLRGAKSSLFYDYVRVLSIVKPKYFLFENVRSMQTEDRNIITEALGVKPYTINSSLVSAQERERYYWTNIPNIKRPSHKGLYLKHIVETEVADKYWYKQDHTYHGYEQRPIATLHINGHDILKRVYGLNQKAPTLTAVTGGYQEKKVYIDGKVRKLTPVEYERLQTVPDNYTAGVSDSQRYKMLGNGWTVDVIAHIFESLKEVEDL